MELKNSLLINFNIYLNPASLRITDSHKNQTLDSTSEPIILSGTAMVESSNTNADVFGLKVKLRPFFLLRIPDSLIDSSISSRA